MNKNVLELIEIQNEYNKECDKQGRNHGWSLTRNGKSVKENLKNVFDEVRNRK